MPKKLSNHEVNARIDVYDSVIWYLREEFESNFHTENDQAKIIADELEKSKIKFAKKYGIDLT